MSRVLHHSLSWAAQQQQHSRYARRKQVNCGVAHTILGPTICRSLTMRAEAPPRILCAAGVCTCINDETLPCSQTQNVENERCTAVHRSSRALQHASLNPSIQQHFTPPQPRLLPLHASRGVPASRHCVQARTYRTILQPTCDSIDTMGYIKSTAATTSNGNQQQTREAPSATSFAVDCYAYCLAVGPCASAAVLLLSRLASLFVGWIPPCLLYGRYYCCTIACFL